MKLQQVLGYIHPSDISTKIINMDVLHTSLHRFNMITMSDDILRIRTVFVGPHDLQRDHHDGCGHFELSDIHDIYVIMTVMYMMQCFLLSVFHLMVSAHIFNLRCLSILQVTSVCHAPQPCLLSARKFCGQSASFEEQRTGPSFPFRLARSSS